MTLSNLQFALIITIGIKILLNAASSLCTHHIQTKKKNKQQKCTTHGERVLFVSLRRKYKDTWLVRMTRTKVDGDYDTDK